MSIYAYTGLPGSGKSYSVVEHQVLPALKSGRRLVTNVALRFDDLRAAFPGAELVELPTQRVQADPAVIYEYVTPGSVVVLDEVWRLFPAGLKANHVPEPFRKLLAEHRHMVDAAGNSCQIVLVTQDLAQISAFARQLIEQTFRTVKLTSVGLQKQYRVDVYNGPAIGPNPSESSRIRQLFGAYKSDVWKYYQSHTLVAEGGEASKVNEKAVDGRANILKRPVMVLGALAAVALLYFGVSRLLGIVDQQSGSVQAAEVAPSALAEPPPVRVVSPDRPPAPSVVRAVTAGVAAPVAWRVVGFVDNEEDESRSRVILQQGEVITARPLYPYCNFEMGWLRCTFPDLGALSM